MNDQERDELMERVSQALDVPEPSPLFWDHFPGRVRAAVQAAPAGARFGWWKRHAGMLALSMTLIAALVSWTVITGRPDAADTSTPVAIGGTAPLDDVLDDMEDPDGDAGWAVVSSVAASAGLDALREAGFGVAPGGAEAAIDDLSDAQRAALVAMLQAEMKGDDAGSL